MTSNKSLQKCLLGCMYPTSLKSSIDWPSPYLFGAFPQSYLRYCFLAIVLILSQIKVTHNSHIVHFFSGHYSYIFSVDTIVNFVCTLSSREAIIYSSQFSPSVVSDSVTPCTAACQTSLSLTNSRSSPKLMSIESVMSSNHLILGHPLLLLHSIFPSIRVFSNESDLRIRWPKY